MTIGRMLLDWALVNLALTVLVCAWTVGVGFWRAHRERWEKARRHQELVEAGRQFGRHFAQNFAILAARQRIRLAAQARDPNAWDTE